jgi:hypothetical protein
LEADLLRERASSKEISFEQLTQADAVCFLKTLLDSTDRAHWMPHALVYKGYHGPFELFRREELHADFKKIALFLGVQSKDDLFERFERGGKANRIDQWAFFFHAGVNLKTLYNFDKLDTV